MEGLTETHLQRNTLQLHSLISDLIDVIILLYKDDAYLVHQKSERSKTSLSKLKGYINEFELSPKLLDTYIERYITLLSELYLYLYKSNKGSTTLSRDISEIIYSFSKIRGFKIITQFFPSDVYIIPFLIKINDGISDDYELFVNLIWLSNLVLVPFELSRISDNLSLKLLEIGVKNVEGHCNGSKNQLASLILLSRLVTRSDMIKEGILEKYILSYVEPVWEVSSVERYQKSLGHLMTLNKILKRSDTLLISQYLEIIIGLVRKDLSDLRIQSQKNHIILNSLNATYLTKVSSKLTDFYLDSHLYAKVSDFVNFCNEIINLMGNNFDSKLRFTIAKSLSNVCSNLGRSAINYQEQLIIYIVAQLEINGLDFKYLSYVQPNGDCCKFNPNVILHYDEVQISKFHTVLLFLGYTCLHKTLPKHLIPSVLSMVHVLLFFERKSMNSALGNQIKDSSCFIIWAMCRMMTKDDFRFQMNQNSGMMETIFFDLIKAGIFDRDLVIRRCCIAAIQELTGRFGNVLFENSFEDAANVGEFVISFVQVFNNDAVGTIERGFDIIHELTALGFDKELFLHLLLDNITNVSLNFEIRKLNVACLKKLVLTEQNKSIKFDIIYKTKFESLKDSLVCFKDSDSSYFLGEILLIIPSQDFSIIQNMTMVLESVSNNCHNSTIETTEGYIKWMNFLLTQDLNVNSLLKNFTEILKSNYSRNLVEECQQLFLNLSIKNINLNHHGIFEKICHSIQNNNLTLASSIFYFKNLSMLDIFHLLSIIDSSSISFEARSRMIESLNDNIKFLQLQEEHFMRIVCLLDDYTTTEQGDVGSRIRYATLELIENNWDSFIVLKNPIKLRLVRLSGEVFDKVRLKSFTLLNHLDGCVMDCSSLSYSQYFESLFGYYLQFIEGDDETSLEFWRGVSFSLGSTAALQSLLKSSFTEFVIFLSNINDDLRLEVYLFVLKLLKISNGSDLKSLDDRHLKLLLVALNVFVKLFECGCEFPKGFDYNTLFIRSYNLHLNTTNSLRIGLVLKIFHFLSTNSEVPYLILHSCCKRLIWIGCQHPKSLIRNLAGEQLFEVINDRDIEDKNKLHVLESIDWDQSPADLQKNIKKLQNIYFK